jgi:hypothetical protein
LGGDQTVRSETNPDLNARSTNVARPEAPLVAATSPVPHNGSSGYTELEPVF